MGLMDWLRGATSTPGDWQPTCQADWIQAGAWRFWGPPFNLVVGESFRRDELTSLAGPPREQGYLIPVEVRFERESENPKDPNALLAMVGDTPVGYLRADAAGGAAPDLDAARVRSFTCCGVIRGGSLRAPDLGVHVWIDRSPVPSPPIRVEGAEALAAPWPPEPGEGDVADGAWF